MDTDEPDSRFPSKHGAESLPPAGCPAGEGAMEPDGFGLLSPREREVYHWICQGKRDREIATILGISYRTVGVHVGAILAKLGVENRTSAAILSRIRNQRPDELGRPSKIAYFYVLLMADFLHRVIDLSVA